MSVNSQKKGPEKAESGSKKFRQKTPVWTGRTEEESMGMEEVMKKLWLGFGQQGQ